MKRILLLIFLFSLPMAHSKMVASVVDFGDGEVITQCVNIYDDDTVYNVFKNAERASDDLDFNFDGVLTGTPYIRCVNDYCGKSLSSTEFIGWNFWVTSDNDFVDPPELAPGWGSGIGDYIPGDKEVIAIRYGSTEYNSDWSVKTPPKKPEFVSYDEICFEPIIEFDVEVDGDDQKLGNVEIKPGSTLDLELDLDNPSGVDLENVKVEVKISGLDVEDESDDFDLDAGDDDKIDFSLEIPFDLDRDSYDLEVIVSFKLDGHELDRSFEYELGVDKERHELTLLEASLTPSIECGEVPRLDLHIINTGKNDEEATLTISSPELSFYQQHELKIKEEGSFADSFYLNLDDPEQGSYVVDLIIEYENEIRESFALDVNCPSAPAPQAQAVKQVIPPQQGTQETKVVEEDVPLWRDPFVLGIIVIYSFIILFSILLFRK